MKQFKEYRQINEHTDTPEFQELETALRQAIIIGEKFGNHVNRDEVRNADLYSDMTGHKIERYLKKIYNAAIYGDRNNDRSREIFKDGL